MSSSVPLSRSRRLTERMLRATIRHNARLVLREDIASIASATADAIYGFNDVVDALSTSTDRDELFRFAKVGKPAPAVVNAFRDALEMHGEFDTDPYDAWLEAWRAANLITRN